MWTRKKAREFVMGKSCWAVKGAEDPLVEEGEIDTVWVGELVAPKESYRSIR